MGGVAVLRPGPTDDPWIALVWLVVVLMLIGLGLAVLLRAVCVHEPVTEERYELDVRLMPLSPDHDPRGRN